MDHSDTLPPDVMEAAKAGFRAFSPSPTAFDAFNTALIVEGIARAIMVERERCASYAERAEAEWSNAYGRTGAESLEASANAAAHIARYIRGGQS